MNNNDTNTSPNKNESAKMPDLLDFWKDVYFRSEQNLGNAIKEYLTNQSFIDMLDQMRSSFLPYYKIANQSLDKYLEINPVPSKKDIARVAELVISLEDKTDNIELRFSADLAAMAEKLQEIADMQILIKDQLDFILAQDSDRQ